MAEHFPELSESDLDMKANNKLGDRMIRELTNAVIAKYCNLLESCKSKKKIAPQCVLVWDFSQLNVDE